ncbi:hypothetical protein C8R47DRAFT_962812, partial [Mycena vitilis]
MPRAFQWSRTHACSFDLGKFQLVHFTRNPNRYVPVPLVTPAHTIQASESATYLGLVMDRSLRWKEQVQRAVAKGTKAIMAINRLTRPTFGLPHKFVRQLYRSVVIP